MADSFIFYKSFADGAKGLPDQDRLELYDAIIAYGITGEELDGLGVIASAMLQIIKPQIEANRKRYEAGLKGGRPKKEDIKKPMVFENEENQKPMVFNKSKNKKPMVFENEETEKPNYNDNDNVNENENEDNKNIDHRSGDRAQDQPEVVTLLEKRFEEFWSLYPRKVGKLKAFQSFKRINPNKELFENMMTALRENIESNAQWKRDNGQYIPHPTTWLNQGRWFDEIATDAPGAGEDFFTRALKGEIDF